MVIPESAMRIHTVRFEENQIKPKRIGLMLCLCSSAIVKMLERSLPQP